MESARKLEGQSAAAGEAAEKRKAREFFATRLGVFVATLGSAVGLGNIWKFPYLTGSNGGAAFLIIYILATLAVGIPVMISEHVIGRTARGNAVASLRRLAPAGQLWWLVGAAGILASFLIMAFYTEVAGWVFAYIFKSITGGMLSTDPAVTTAAFTSLIIDPAQSLIWQWVVLVVVGGIILLGVTKGIERTTKTLMPVLLVILVVIGIRSLTLPGAEKGLEFLFKPDFSKITGATVLTALGLAFFKLSIGMGTMITYGSYFREDQNIPVTAARVAFSDLAVSILAGIAVFPAVFAFGFEPNAGPSLLFITIPAVFASMPLGGVFMVLFFLLAAIAAIGAMLSLVEVTVAFINETFKVNRVAASLITIVLIGLVGSTAALSNSTLADVKLFGLTFFDLFDFVSSNVLLPLGGLSLSIFVGWVWGWPQVKRALSNDGQLKNEKFIQVFYGVIKFVSPVLVLVVLLSSLGVI